MENILEALLCLCEPSDSEEKTSTVQKTPEEYLLAVIESTKLKIQLDESTIEQIKDSSASWQFTRTILDVLCQLSSYLQQTEKTLTEDQKTIELLSIQSQVLVNKSIELVIGFGILPYLLPNVGLPNELRQPNSAADVFSAQDKTIPQLQQFKRLVFVIESILDICHYDTIRRLLVAKNLTNFLAACLQICGAPIANPRLMKKEDVQKFNMLSFEEYDDVMLIRTKFNQKLKQDFLPNVPTSTLIQSLFLIGSKQPKWIQKLCQQMLNEILLSNNGLVITCLSFFDTLVPESKVWEVPKIISSLMGQALTSCHMNYEDTFCSMCNQNIKLIQSSKDNINLIRTGIYCGVSLSNLNFKLTFEHLWSKIFDPVLKFNSTRSNISSSVKDINNCVAISQTIIDMITPAQFQITLITSIFDLMWSLFLEIFVICQEYTNRKVKDVNVEESVMDLAKQLKHFLISLVDVFIRACESDISIFCTNLLLHSHWINTTLVCTDFSITETGEIIRYSEERRQMDESKSPLEEIRGSCSILCSEILKNDTIMKFIPRLFSQLLSHKKEVSSSISNSNNTKHTSTTTDVNNSKLLSEWESCQTLTENECRKFIELELISHLGEDETVLFESLCKDMSQDNTEDSLAILDMLMNSITSELENLGQFDNAEFCETLLFALGILGTLCETAATSREKESSKNNNPIWLQLEKFYPKLQILRKSQNTKLINAGIPTMAEDIVTNIETRGTGNIRKKVEQISSKYEAAIADVNNVMIPIKGHGILQLRRLIEEKDKITLEHQDNLLEIFKTHLHHDDSYIYLMAIQGLAALGIKFHKDIVPLLVKEYDDVDWNADEGKNKKKVMSQSLKKEEFIELRMKVGEVLVKVVQKLGDMAHVYRAIICNACFRLVSDDEPLIRASALSNLGELCHFLKFSLGIILTEVWYCVGGLLQSERSPEVRRAALHLMVLLLRGVANDIKSEDILKSRELSTYMRDARRVLTQIQNTEPDPTAKTHAQLALKELEIILVKLLVPSQKLEYKIHILNP